MAAMKAVPVPLSLPAPLNNDHTPSNIIDTTIPALPSNPLFSSVSTTQPLPPADTIFNLSSNCVCSPMDAFELHHQTATMHELQQKYRLSHIQNHRPWIWSSKGGGEWIPHYQYYTANGIQREQVWEEYVDGLDGHFSIQKLNE